jgi:hypothetical protein
MSTKLLIEELEPGMDELFQRLIPDLMDWQGATADEIETIDQIVREISGAGMPKFYRWFLMRMGHSMGKFGYHDMDYSVATILSWYNGNFEDDGSKFFKIGHTSEPELELHMYYDFNYPARDDARVTMRQAEGGEDYRDFETFREMLATKAVSIHAGRFPVFCTGTMLSDNDILSQLDPVMDSLGFKKPAIPTGPRCGLYEGRQAIMVTTSSLDLGTESCGFMLGGNDANSVRNVLGTITTETEFTLNVKNDPRQLKERS